jgi:aspartyl-tRNA(Asn)/glutamyl-tRNA(Gln) amidotransferase subunit C
MPLTREEVRKIALLARLELSAAEEAMFTDQLDRILDDFRKLERLDTDAVEPTAHVVAIDDAYREDIVSNLPATDALRSNAPAAEGTSFRVPKIIE